METREVLSKLKNGEISIDEAEQFFRRQPFEEMGYAKLDMHRKVRSGFAEVIYCSGKADEHLLHIFEKLYVEESGQGYPRERAVPEQRNKKIPDEVKTHTYRDLTDILKDLDQDLVKGALSGAKFKEMFYANCKCDKIAAAVKEIIGE